MLVKLPPLVCVFPLKVSGAPSNVIAILPAGKLVPLTVTCVPTGPEAGERGLRLALAVVPVTVKLAVFTIAPTVTVMVWTRGSALDGIVITLAKLPTVSVWVLLVGVRGVLVSNKKETGVLAGKLVPLIATKAPGSPEVAERARAAGRVTVKVLDSVMAPAVTVMVWAPAVAVAGMVIMLKKSPLLSVVVCPDVGVMKVVSNLKTRGVLAGKLLPEIPTGVPGGPEVGSRVSRVAPWVTVKVALAFIMLSPNVVIVVA